MKRRKGYVYTQYTIYSLSSDYGTHVGSFFSAFARATTFNDFHIAIYNFVIKYTESVKTNRGINFVYKYPFCIL